MTNSRKYIFVVGGVMSGVGKGVATSSIALILQGSGLTVTAIKIDPYVNVDAGTMNPTEHGEVFVLNDGMECDQDMGNYERFLGYDLTRTNYMTTGSVYLDVINKERNLGYKGKSVSPVPHIPLAVIEQIDKAAKKNNADITITEIGGTVGEYENILFLEAVRMLKIKRPHDIALVLVSYLPMQGVGNELKTKPTQHAVRALNSAGLQPDIIIARAKVPLDKKRREKIAFNCSLSEDDVISAPNVENIYDVPINFEKGHISHSLRSKLGLEIKKTNIQGWKKFVQKMHNADDTVRIGIVGKYFGTGDFVLADSYLSVIEAIKHSAYNLNKKPIIEWLNAEDYEAQHTKDYKSNLSKLSELNGVIVPGGFGARGVEGKINVIEYLRTNNIPFLGLCYGLQLAVIEYSRNVLGLTGANTREVDPNSEHMVIDVMPDQKTNIERDRYGGTMRLGAYPAVLQKDTLANDAYGKDSISERHRHRYEVNPDYIQKLHDGGLVFSGKSPDEKLMEIIELPKAKHKFFLATQFHPEFQSRPLTPHPLFSAFIKAVSGRV